MLLEDLTFPFFRAIALGIGLRPWFEVAAMFALVGLLVAFRRRLRVVGWGLLGTAGAVGCLGLLAISECQDEQRLTPIITARPHTFADASRESAQIGLMAVPAVFALTVALRRRLAFNRRRTHLSTYLRIAGKAFFDGNFDRAIAEYSIAIRVDPTRTQSYLKRGQALLEKGDYGRAVADFDRTIAIDPYCGGAYLNRGIVEAARGNNEAAIVNFERAIEINPGQAAAILYRGLSLAKVGDTVRAADDFRRILKLTNHSDFTEPAKFHLAMIENRPTRLVVLLAP